MPTYDDRKKTINYYGVFALWSSILLLASYFSLLTSGCDDQNQFNGNSIPIDITIFLAINFIFGILLFLTSFCHIAQKLYRSKCIFYSIVILIIILSCLLLYVSYKTIDNQCHIGRYYERNRQLADLNLNLTIFNKDDFEKTLKQVHQNRNQHYLAAAILDLLASILLFASAYAFRNRF